MAINSEPSVAWIQTADGQQLPLGRTCSVGRSSSNDLVLKSERISRKHALIHTQDKNEYWVVDFGSSNGTWLNGRRITQPTRLRDDDRIELADVVLKFTQAAEPRTAGDDRFTARSTSYETRMANCWLLLADIVGSTKLSEKHTEKELPVVLGKWFFECKQLIEAHEGGINKFLGDGFFAYWEEGKNAAENISKTIALLKEAQKNAEPEFRIVVHYGEVSIGGSALMLEEIIGRAVNFVFRMEKLAGKLGSTCVLSGAAKRRLPNGADATSLGEHPLAGFDGDFPFYSL
jgi:adenylate cyclase